MNQLNLGDLTPEEREAKRKPRKELPAVKSCEVIIQLCNCRSFNEQPHSIKRHDELASDYDWRLESERRVKYKGRWEK